MPRPFQRQRGQKSNLLESASLHQLLNETTAAATSAAAQNGDFRSLNACVESIQTECVRLLRCGTRLELAQAAAEFARFIESSRGRSVEMTSANAHAAIVNMLPLVIAATPTLSPGSERIPGFVGDLEEESELLAFVDQLSHNQAKANTVFLGENSANGTGIAVALKRHLHGSFHHYPEGASM